MNSDRIKMLEKFMADDPTDPFNPYALGLELAKSDHQKAKEVFDGLMLERPDYVPVYYQAAVLYLAMHLREQATEIIDKGIVQAKKQGNLKTVNELNSLLDELN